jgi:hypothetical protein
MGRRKMPSEVEGAGKATLTARAFQRPTGILCGRVVAPNERGASELSSELFPNATLQD